MNNKIKGLFLDDERVPSDVTWIQYPDNVEWIIARNYQEFFDVFRNDEFDIITFDHDIQSYVKGEEKTGYDCLKLLLEYYNDDFVEDIKFFFHTQNPVGKKNMECYYNNYVKFMKENNND